MLGWRFFSVISLLSQLLRVPIVLLLVSDLMHLDDYFVIVATSIPAQFFATEVLLYRGFSFGDKKGRVLDCSIIAIWLISLLYFVFYNSLISSFYYILFSLSIVCYGFFQFQLREKLGAIKFLHYDALTNFLVTLSCVLVVVFLPSELSSYLLIFATSVIYLVFSCFIFFFFKNNRFDFYSNIKVQTSGDSRGYLFQVILMITTQLERMIIGLIWPTFLAYISIIGASTNAWRRLTLDDSILFSNLKSDYSVQVAISAFIKYRNSSAFFAFVGVLFTSLYVNFVPHHVGFLSIDISTLTCLVSLSLIYLAVMPSGIVTINLIRSSKYTLHLFSFLYSYFVLVFLLSSLFYVSNVDVVNTSFIWFIVIMTASVNLVIFTDYLNAVKRFEGKFLIPHLILFLLLFMVFYYVK